MTALAMTEDDLLTAILDAAMFLGWRVMHIRRSDRAIVQGHQGFPDLVLARDGRLRFYELKSAKGQLTEDQWAWQLALRDRSTIDTFDREVRVVRPADLDDVIESLR